MRRMHQGLSAFLAIVVGCSWYLPVFFISWKLGAGSVLLTWMFLWHKKHYVDTMPAYNAPQEGDCPCGATTQGVLYGPTNIVFSADGEGLGDTSLDDAAWEAKVEAVLADVRARQCENGDEERAQLGKACRLYNAALQERRDAYQRGGVSLNYYD